MTLALALTLTLSAAAPLPPWADAAAAVVAGEAPAGCEQCDRLVACTILYDVGRGWDPAALLDIGSPRWHGRRRPGEAHYRAVHWALDGGCDELPTCAYLGNLPDLAGWYGSGLVGEREVQVYGNENGAVACVVAEAEIEERIGAGAERGTREDWEERVR